jgi:hypothetical protein
MKFSRTLVRPIRYISATAPVLYLAVSRMAWAGAQAAAGPGPMGTGQPLSLSVIGGILGLWSLAIMAVAFTPTSCFAVGFEPDSAQTSAAPPEDVRRANSMRELAWPKELRDASLPGRSTRELKKRVA